MVIKNNINIYLMYFSVEVKMNAASFYAKGAEWPGARVVPLDSADGCLGDSDGEYAPKPGNDTSSSQCTWDGSSSSSSDQDANVNFQIRLSNKAIYCTQQNPNRAPSLDQFLGTVVYTSIFLLQKNCLRWCSFSADLEMEKDWRALEGQQAEGGKSTWKQKRTPKTFFDNWK